MSIIIETKGFKEFKRAIKKNPDLVQKETSQFLVRGIALYNKSIIRQPWRMGQQGGGAPVDTGNLRDTHRREIRKLSARIFPTSPYSGFVHGLNGRKRNVRGVQLRPWLDYARKKNARGINQLSNVLLTNITKDLAK